MMKTITTQKVNCKDCHRCVRSCPVKAIGIEKGHARLVDDKCIFCGKCVVECPQKAKQVENQLALIQEAIASGRKMIMSLAPSFAGNFPEYTAALLAGAIVELGFTAVEETAIGAEVVSRFYSSLLKVENKTIISSCCPVIVNLVEKYYPALVDNLAPMMSPMMTHGQILKHKYGNDAFVVFAGPCIAKMAEIENADCQYIDAVITFDQLKKWLNHSNLEPSTATFDDEALGNCRYLPIPGGILKSFMKHDETDTEIIAVDGIKKCMEVLDGLSSGVISPRFIEALACTGGCVAGPVNGNSFCTPAKKAKVVAFAKSGNNDIQHLISADLNFNHEYRSRPVAIVMPRKDEIAGILAQTGKRIPKDEKNCGACGYNTCREKAIAVYQGLAEIDMCIPYMRSKAESFANVIVDNSLNGIIVVNDKMVIQEFNPAAERMFNKRCDMVKGLNLAEVIDCTDFVEVAASGRKIVRKRVKYPLLELTTEQMIIPVPEHGLVFGILIDVTANEKRDQEIEQIKLDTVEKATEVITKQMQVAQEIAGLLGETTADTKGALLELIGLIKGKGEK
ncbi:MAG: rsxB 4 [Firmicutes bacterium]|nr:rsxB 4 [Bacillota bacterium]